MDKREEAAMTHRSFDAMTGILSWILGLAKNQFPEFTIEGKRVLEIGTGQFMNHPFGFYLCGAREVVTIDQQRLCVDPGASMKNIVHARRHLSPFVSHDDYTRRLRALEKTEYDLGLMSDLGIHYTYNGHIECAAESYDIVFSYAVLEHVREPAGIIQADYTALKPGGYLIYFVDLEDHRDPKDPFLFLFYPEWQSENRLRLSTYKKIISQFDIDARYPYAPIRNDAPMPPKIHPSIEYTDEDDLRTTAFLMVGSKQ